MDLTNKEQKMVKRVKNVYTSKLNLAAGIVLICVGAILTIGNFLGETNTPGVYSLILGVFVLTNRSTILALYNIIERDKNK